jgi:multidrug resistance efflux pump
VEHFTHISETDQLYFETNHVMKIIFWLLFLVCLVIGVVLPIIKVDITVNSFGVIRPTKERTEVKSLQEGLIVKMNLQNGRLVKKGELLLELNSNPLLNRRGYSNKNKSIFNDQISDLELLCKYRLEIILPSQLKTTTYVEQFQRAKEELLLKTRIIEKLYKEVKRDSLLWVDKVIAKKEFEDKYAEWQQAVQDKQIKERDQLSHWNSELQRLVISLNNINAEDISLGTQVERSKVYAPITGYVQTSTIRYVGSMLLAGESICTISPATSLIAECYVMPKDLGMLKQKQPAIIYIDAYDYRYFGFIRTNINFIEPDISVTDNKQGFKVYCDLPVESLSLKNGYKANIMRGQSIQAKFVVAKRTLWQLLFDSINDWLKPN